MINKAQQLADGAIRFERRFPGTIEQIWEWFALGEKRKLWLAGGGDCVQAGEKVELVFDHNTLTRHDETFPDRYTSMQNGVSFDITVLECDAPNRLVWFWPAEDGNDVEVEFTLCQDRDEVLVTLVQRGEISFDSLISSAAGWHTHLGILTAKLDGTEPMAFWPAHERYVTHYEAALADQNE